MGALAELGLDDAAWVHARSPITADHLEGAVCLVVGWHRAELATLERVHALDTKLEDPAVALGLHVPRSPTRPKPPRVRAALLARGTFAPTACIEGPCPVEPGEVAVLGPDVELRDRFGPEISLEEIVDAVQELSDETDPGFSRGWRSDALGPDALAVPQDVDADDQRIAIADTGHNRVLVTARDGSSTQAVGDGVPAHRDGPLAKARFDTPRGVSLAGDVVYVADAGNHALRRVGLADGTVGTVATCEGAYPSGVAALGGEVAWAQPALGRVAFVDAPPLANPFEIPFDVAFAEDQLYVADRGAGKLWSVGLDDRGVQQAAGGQPVVGPEGVTAPEPVALADPEAGQVFAIREGKALPAFASGSPGPGTPTGLGGDLVVADEVTVDLWQRSGNDGERLAVGEPAVDADEHVVLDPIEIAPSGELELTVRCLDEQPGAQAQPPEVTGPVDPGPGEVDNNSHVTGRVTVGVRASGLVLVGWLLDASNGTKRTVWSLPVIEREGEADRRPVELLARLP